MLCVDDRAPMKVWAPKVGQLLFKMWAPNGPQILGAQSWTMAARHCPALGALLRPRVIASIEKGTIVSIPIEKCTIESIPIEKCTIVSIPIEKGTIVNILIGK